MTKKLAFSSVGFLLLFSPVLASADAASQIAALQAQIRALMAQITALQAQSGGGTSTGGSCVTFTHDLYIGVSDATTNGEVTKLQQFLIKEGVYPEAKVTGFYGNLTAQAVMRWQKAHGMDFVTVTSGVGKQTRVKIAESCGQSVQAGWKTYSGGGFEFMYPESTFKLFPISNYLPLPYYEVKHSGVKIISHARAAKVGQQGCSYGLSGLPSVCSAEGEAGVQFILVAQSQEGLVSKLSPDTQRTVLTIAGHSAIKTSAGAEGDGHDVYFIETGTGKTLVVSREYRYADGGFPLPTLFEQILATLKIK